MWRESMLGFDLETTGTDPETARIVTAAAVTCTPQGADARVWLAVQDEPIPDEATAVHGITTEHANQNGMSREYVIRKAETALSEAWQAGFVVVGHNLSYDLTVLDRELARLHDRRLTVAGPCIDTLVIDKHFDTYRRGKRTLEALATHYGVKLDDAHNAAADALAACRIAWVQASRYKLPNPDELHQHQAGWYRQQRESFIAYKARCGETIEDRSTAWPIH